MLKQLMYPVFKNILTFTYNSSIVYKVEKNMPAIKHGLTILILSYVYRTYKKNHPIQGGFLRSIEQ